MEAPKPLIVQGDRSMFLEVANPLYEDARDDISRFSELEKSPEHIHTYRLSDLSLWNAAAAGLTSEEVINIILKYSRYDIPSNVITDIKDIMSRFGRLSLKKINEGLVLFSEDDILIQEIQNNEHVKKHILEIIDNNSIRVDPKSRGFLKQDLIRIGWPALDLAGYEEGDPLEINLLSTTRSGNSFQLRKYQEDAINVFYRGGGVEGGSGTIVLPCGAGKTVIGMGVISKVKTNTLITCPNVIAVRQWIEEILDKTDLPREKIGEYSGEVKEIRDITVTTYQILTYRGKKDDEFTHFNIFDKKNWGLIIYDEVHLLPAPVFQVTAHIQSKRRLGLTATLVREDGREKDVFSLIGPKKFDMPWKNLEQQGWIAEAICYEIRVHMPEKSRIIYATSDDRNKYRIAAENPFKYEIVKRIIDYHKNDRILIIGMYLEQLEKIAESLKAPLITGKIPNKERERIYSDFRKGNINILVVSKVANFAIDLPDANVAIQVSGTFGSRQEEAQRLGRILRPKKDGSSAKFYSIVTKDTRDQEYSSNRQIFLTEQGYKYVIVDDHNMDSILK